MLLARLQYAKLVILKKLKICSIFKTLSLGMSFALVCRARKLFRVGLFGTFK